MLSLTYGSSGKSSSCNWFEAAKIGCSYAVFIEKPIVIVAAIGSLPLYLILLTLCLMNRGFGNLKDRCLSVTYLSLTSFVGEM